MLFWRRLPPNEAWLLVLRALVLTVDLYRDDATGSVLRLRVSPGLAATAALKLSLAAALLAPVPELSEARNRDLKFGPTLQVPSRWQVALQWIGGTRITELA
jgi:hypothetical protein